VVVSTAIHNQFVKPWTQNEIDYLRENYRKVSRDSLLATLDRSEGAIWHKASELGISNQHSYSYFSEQEIQTIREFYPRAPQKTILSLIPTHNWQSILDKACELGINRTKATKHFIPETFDLTDAEKGYLAGIIDGEGCIWEGYTHCCTKFVTYTPHVMVTNTDMNLMNWVSRVFRSPITENGNFKTGFGKKHCYICVIHRYAGVYGILKALLPYLIVKRSKAESVINKLRERMEAPQGGICA
jgi:hypothetical protein